MILDLYAIEIRGYGVRYLADIPKGATDKSGDLSLPSNFSRFIFATKPESWDWTTPSADSIVQTLGGIHLNTFGFGIQKVTISGNMGFKPRFVDRGLKFLNGYEQVMALYKIYENSKKLKNDGTRFNTVFYNLKVGKAWFINIDSFKIAMNVQRNHQYVYLMEMSILADYNYNVYKVPGVFGFGFDALDKWLGMVSTVQNYLDAIRGDLEIANQLMFRADRVWRKSLQPITTLGDIITDVARTVDNLASINPLLSLGGSLQSIINGIAEAKRSLLSLPSELVVATSNAVKRIESATNLLINNEAITHKKDPPARTLTDKDIEEIEASYKGTDLENGQMELTPLQQQVILISTGYSIEQEVEFESGMSLQRLADELYGDPGMWNLIYETNKEAIGDDPQNILAGTLLKVLTKPTQSIVVNTLAGQLDVFDIWDKDKIFGTGFVLKDGDIVFNSDTGQYDVVSGLDNLIQVLQVRMLTRLRTLVRYSEYGNYALNLIGRTGINENQQIVAVEVEKTLLAEPRVTNVKNVKVTKSKDAFFVEAEILPIFKEDYQTIKQELVV
ncbi:MAG TPA: hypothetical protein VMV77_01715 [Bacteroidales bacterium]|nr:hypothetical protein [Bacteroidales bacterium]